MVKKIAISAGVFAIAALSASSVAFAQTTTPTTTTTVTTATTDDAAMPESAPSTGRAEL